MIIDCHGHYTTAPQSLWDWRKGQVADPKNFSRKLNISDQEIRDSLEGAQLKIHEIVIELSRSSKLRLLWLSAIARSISGYSVACNTGMARSW